MTKIKTFTNQEFGAIRTMQGENGETWFCAKDVADALGYNNTRDAVRRHIDEDDKTTVAIHDSGSNYKTRAIFINESGLYALVLSSKLDSVRRFKHWVTSEVLPAIRRQGGYIAASTADSDEVILARALKIMQSTIERRDAQIAKLKPKADYADEVLNSVSCFTTTQIAKGLGMTANELNRLLCDRRIQYGQSGQYMLYAPYARQGLATNRIHYYHDILGDVHTSSRLVWTERGREFIYELLQCEMAA